MMHRKKRPWLIVKIGSNSLIENTSGSEKLDKALFLAIASQVEECIQRDYMVIIVSSGAITAGLVASGVTKRPAQDKTTQLQRLASIGQHRLMAQWQSAFGSTLVGEVLITRRELVDIDEHRKELVETLAELTQNGDIPIINENDALSHEEISFGDNDLLSAHLALTMKNSPLFSDEGSVMLLSDINGLYRDPADSTSVIACVEDAESVTGSIVVSETSKHGSGGIASKLQAASLLNKNGIVLYLTNAREDMTIARTLRGDIGTRFQPAQKHST